MNQRTPANMLSGKYGVIEPPPARDSARLQWRAVADWTPLDPPMRADTIAALRRVFGAPPHTLTDEHLPELRAIAAVGGAHYGQQLEHAVGRPITLALVGVDEALGEVGIASYNMPRAELIAHLKGAVAALESGNHSTTVVVNGQVVAGHEGKPS